MAWISSTVFLGCPVVLMIYFYTDYRGEDPKMKFELTGKLVLEANDIEDAFRRIAEHFTILADGEDSHIPRPGTDIRLKRAGLKTPLPPKPKRFELGPRLISAESML